MDRLPCRYFSSSSGCRKGNKCQFAHLNSNRESAAPTGPSGPSTTRRTFIPRTQSPSSAPTTRAPPGVCHFYWKNGQCNREFDCRFQHDRPDSTHKSSRAPHASTMRAAEEVAPFLTENGLAKINSNATDGFFSNVESSLSPTDAHRQLKRFLVDDYKFRNPFEVYSFVVPLCSANPTNTLWVCFFWFK